MRSRAGLILLALISVASFAYAQAASTNDLDSRAIQRRAVEAVIWGMPAVNTALMYDQMLKAGGKANQIIYWGRPLDWRNQTLTPNPDTLYSMGFYDTKAAGPMVIEIPPAGDDGSLNANFVTLWQASLEDVGLLGVDKGAGVKLVITPPGYTGKVPDGFERLPSDTFTGFFLVRSNLKSHADADVQKSIAYAKKVKFYPLSQIGNPPATVFTDVKDATFDSTIKYDLSFFTLLDRVVQNEPWIDRDRAMIDQLRLIGIEKGKPFNPDDNTKKALAAGVADARHGLPPGTMLGFPPSLKARTGPRPGCPKPSKANQQTMPTPMNSRSMGAASPIPTATSPSNGSGLANIT